MGALVIADGSGTAVLAAINAALAQLAVNNAGSARPADAGAGTIWVDKDTPSATSWTVFLYDGADDIPIGYVNTTTNYFTPANAALIGALKNQITGLTWANNVSDATNDIDIAAGWCVDATGVYQMSISALTKRLDASWAVGTNQGGLDTGSIGNSDYYIWAIARSDTGVTDALFSLSATAPTMPSNYDYKRRIGWFRRTGGAIVAFKTYELAGGGIEYAWTTPIRDVNVANTLTTSRRTDALSVPLAFSTIALIRAIPFDASAGFYAAVCCPDETDSAPSGTAAPGSNMAGVSTGQAAPFEGAVRTSATGTVASRATLATVDNYIIVTRGFIDSRR